MCRGAACGRPGTEWSRDLWQAWLNNGFSFDGGASSLAGGGGADFDKDDRWRRPCVARSGSVRVSVGEGAGEK